MARVKAVVVPDDPEDDENDAAHPYTSKPISQIQKNLSSDKNYDQAHGWFVCLAGFLVQGWIFGIVLNFNMFFKAFQEAFQAEETVVTWIGSLSWCMFLTGPLASMVIIRVGSTVAISIGAALMCVGFLSSSFAYDVYQLYATYGFIIGCGMGLPFLASYSVLGHYFRRHLRLVNVLITIGGGVGIPAFGALFEFLIETYGWRGCLLINAGISLHLIPLGMIMQSQKKDPSQCVPGIREMLGVHVLQLAKFRWMVLHMFLWNFGLGVLFIQLVKVVQDTANITNQEAGMVAIIQGVFNTVGRCIAILFLYQRYFDIMKVYVVCSILMGVFEIIMSACGTQIGFTVVASGVALNFGLMLCYIVPVFIELVGVESVTAALGYSNLAQGVGGIIGPPLIDVAVHGVYLFLVGGFFTTASGVAAAISIFMHFRQMKYVSGKNALPVEDGFHDGGELPVS